MILVTKRYKGSFFTVYWSLEKFNKPVKIPNSSWFSKSSQGVYIHVGNWLLTFINDKR
jgi:hypothetical protein